MTEEIISRQTLEAFIDYLVRHATLTEISILFSSEGLFHEVDCTSPMECTRDLVESFLSRLDFTNPGDARKMLNVFQAILNRIPDLLDEDRKYLIDILKKNGFDYKIFGKFAGSRVGKVVAVEQIPPAF